MLDVASDDLAEGSILAQKYRLERVVGQGGMGVVWAAREVASSRPVALKLLLGHRDDAKARERFLREARAAMAIAHPHVARVEAVLETDVGTPFLVMELLAGESMRQWLRRRAPLSPIETARVMAPVAAAVSAAHAAGIVHRDLKPENVFLVNGHDVRVLDFGIAKRVARADDTHGSTSLTSTGAVMGTPVYMAPEQVFGDQDIDARADVWSLGIMLYECLTGRRPTEGDGFGQIVKLVTTARLVPLDEARPGLPRALTSLVARMLSRDRDVRPTAAEAADVLRAIETHGDAPMPTTVPFARPLVRTEIATSPPPFVPTGPTVAEQVTRDQKRTGRILLVAVLGATVLVVGLLVALLAIGTWVNDRDSSSRADIAREDDAAGNALLARDGKLCLKHLDAHDVLAPASRATLPSTDPRSPLAEKRAFCMMLAGDCAGGQARLRQHLAAIAYSGDPEPIVARATQSHCAR